MTHAWCHDIARDAAVRADEDGRTGPLPTLGEAIARPFADAAKCSVPVSKTGEGQSGLRTERLTLDITSAHDERLADCIVESIGDCLLHGESVRVVDEDREAADRVSREEGYRVLLAEVLAAREERDSAIRERESLREQLESVACRAATAETALESRNVTRGEGSCAAPAASGGGEQPRGWLTEVEREAVDAARDYFDNDDHGNSECVFIARVLKQLLARSLPPGPDGDA